jgi:hypothetical protein
MNIKDSAPYFANTKEENLTCEMITFPCEIENRTEDGFELFDPIDYLNSMPMFVPFSWNLPFTNSFVMVGFDPTDDVRFPISNRLRLAEMGCV